MLSRFCEGWGGSAVIRVKTHPSAKNAERVGAPSHWLLFSDPLGPMDANLRHQTQRYSACRFCELPLLTGRYMGSLTR
jgi:hypothetical protein